MKKTLEKAKNGGVKTARKAAPPATTGFVRAAELGDGCFRALRFTINGELRLGRTVYRRIKGKGVQVVRVIDTEEEKKGTAFDDSSYSLPSSGALVVPVSG